MCMNLINIRGKKIVLEVPIENAPALGDYKYNLKNSLHFFFTLTGITEEEKSRLSKNLGLW